MTSSPGRVGRKACQKCYRSRKHGNGPKVVHGSRRQGNCEQRSVVVDKRSRKGCCVLGAWSES